MLPSEDLGQETVKNLWEKSEKKTPCSCCRIENAVGVTVALLAAAAYPAFGMGSESHTLTGDLALAANSNLSPGDDCTGTGGYSGTHASSQVVVGDETGKALATTMFGPGIFDGQSCVFPGTVKDVPKAACYGESSARGAGAWC